MCVAPGRVWQVRDSFLTGWSRQDGPVRMSPPCGPKALCDRCRLLGQAWAGRAPRFITNPVLSGRELFRGHGAELDSQLQVWSNEHGESKVEWGHRV